MNSVLVNSKGVLCINGEAVSWPADSAHFRKRVLPHPQGLSVLMAGLGLGADVLFCLEHEIQKLIVVELVPEVIQLFFHRYPGVRRDPRLQVVLGSFPECVNLEKSRDIFDHIVLSISDYALV